MKPNPHRRNFILGSSALLAQSSLARFAFAQPANQITVPTIDGLVIRVLTDSSYDTPRPGPSKWVKVTEYTFGA